MCCQAVDLDRDPADSRVRAKRGQPESICDERDDAKRQKTQPVKQKIDLSPGKESGKLVVLHAGKASIAQGFGFVVKVRTVSKFRAMVFILC